MRACPFFFGLQPLPGTESAAEQHSRVGASDHPAARPLRRKSLARLGCRLRSMTDADAKLGPAGGVVVPLQPEYGPSMYGPAMPLSPPPVADGASNGVSNSTAARKQREDVAVRRARRERREERRAEKAAQREKEEADALKALEETARKMYYGGFFLLPMLWLVALLYFRQEHRAEGGNPKIKRCTCVRSGFASFCTCVMGLMLTTMFALFLFSRRGAGGCIALHWMLCGR